jgi:Protein of unknown function (DUF4446)
VNDLNTLVTGYVGAVVVALAVACALLVVLAILLLRRTSRLDRRLRGLTRGEDGRSLEAILDAHLDKVYAVARELDELAARSAVLEATQRRALQRIGLVRFNPFEDTGGNQSFALAVLDAQGNGFVVSSLHARTGTRVYGKTISGGTSESNLSAEEAEALRLALASGAGPAKAG